MQVDQYWNGQLKFSQILPDFEASLKKMSSASMALAESCSIEKLTYGEELRQWFEWTSGEGISTDIPVIIHGGYWRALDAENHRFMMAGFLDTHQTIANVEYRLMPNVRLKDVVHDTITAVHALSKQFPKRKFLLVGHSAGAHLALSAVRDAEIRDSVKAIVALSGIFDLRPIKDSFLQAELSLTAEEIEEFSLSPVDVRVPTVFANGSDETAEYLRGSALMASAELATWTLWDNANHMSLPFEAISRTAEIQNLLEQLGG